MALPASIWYKHKHVSDFCAPNSLYTMVHTNILNYGSKFNGELLGLDNVASRISYSRGSGSKLSADQLTRLSLAFLRELKSVDKTIIAFEVEEHSWGDISFLLNKLRNGELLCICVPFKLYSNYFDQFAKPPPCLTSSETEPGWLSTMSHCVTMIPVGDDRAAILDPNCQYSSNGPPENFSNFINANLTKLHVLEIETFIKEILMARRDTLDDGSKQVIHTKISRTQQTKPQKSIYSFGQKV